MVNQSRLIASRFVHEHLMNIEHILRCLMAVGLLLFGLNFQRFDATMCFCSVLFIIWIHVIINTYFFCWTTIRIRFWHTKCVDIPTNYIYIIQIGRLINSSKQFELKQSSMNKTVRHTCANNNYVKVQSTIPLGPLRVLNLFFKCSINCM